MENFRHLNFHYNSQTLQEDQMQEVIISSRKSQIEKKKYFHDKSEIKSEKKAKPKKMPDKI